MALQHLRRTAVERSNQPQRRSHRRLRRLFRRLRHHPGQLVPLPQPSPQPPAPANHHLNHLPIEYAPAASPAPGTLHLIHPHHHFTQPIRSRGVSRLGDAASHHHPPSPQQKIFPPHKGTRAPPCLSS